MPGKAFFRPGLLSKFVVLNFLVPRIFIQRNPIVFQLLLQSPHVFHHVMKFAIVLNALGRTAFQLIEEERMCVRPFRISGRRDLIVGQAVFKSAFAELGQISQTREDNI